MKTVQLKRNKTGNWEYLSANLALNNPLVLVFGSRFLLEDAAIYSEVRALFKNGHIVFGSTSGNIISNLVEDESITITAVEFEKSKFLIKTTNILNANNALKDSYETAEELITSFPKEGLKHTFVLSEGSFINGSQLTKGFNSGTKGQSFVTGALCGDGSRFKKTITAYNEAPKEGEIVAIGFYGESLEVSFSIKGGWTPFGPERIVTKSKNNILYEIDHQPALDLYKKYLGEKSEQLPSAALLYPLNVTSLDEKQSIVRTILNIDEQENSMILAGDIQEGAKVQLMLTNVDNIVNAAELAAKQAIENRTNEPQLAILVSCIGRKLVLDQRTEEEVEEVIEAIGPNTAVCGLYSYGEIAPFHRETDCKLHNQTMTITLISE